MPGVSTIHILVGAVGIIAGFVAGWLVRGRRNRQEKSLINAGWQEQIEAQRAEHARLLQQNKGLMEQISQFRASNTDTETRAATLATALKDAQGRRDQLQRERKDLESELVAIADEKRRLERDLRRLTAADHSSHAALAEKDDKIFKLSRELDSWNKRLPPLVRKFRERNADAERLEQELADARESIRALEAASSAGETRIESAGRDTLSEGLNASNDTLGVPGPVMAGPGHRLPDDLKRIKGIGPAIERTLHELGIVRLRQIAELGEYDIDRIANRLRGFRSRIYREDWIGQARELTLPPDDVI